MKIAVVCDWLVTFAGAERLLAGILKCFPEADLFAVIDFLEPKDRAFLQNKTATTTFIQNLPFAKKKYRAYLPLMPLAIEQLDVSDYDVVISNSHAVAKGIITGPDQIHISYICSPIRYAWDLQHQYLRESNLESGLKGYLAKYFLHKMRLWDQRTAHGVDHFLAISNFIARRINKTYRRESHVIYPPVDTELFKPGTAKEDFYLTASRMVPYKKIDLIVETFTAQPDKQLIVIGDGPDFTKIKAKAGKNVTLLGYQSHDVLLDHMQRAKAFVFAAEEDFGIVPIEAQACGTPVIAFGKGAARETIRDLTHSHPTGVFFDEQSTTALSKAIQLFEQHHTDISLENCQENATQFATPRFYNQFSQFVQEKISL